MKLIHRYALQAGCLIIIARLKTFDFVTSITQPVIFMANRRSFITKSLGFSSVLSLPSLIGKARAEDVSDALTKLNTMSPVEASQDEALWARIAQAYTVNPQILNLNNGE